MAAPVPTGTLTIREAASPAECGEISALFTSIWGGHQHIPPELGRAIVESGGYVVAARRGERRRRCLGRRRRSVARTAPPALAHHRGRARRATQRRRPRARSAINARGRANGGWPASCGRSIRSCGATRSSTSPGSGARATRYEIDFYGPVRDAINGEDETDRLVVEWADRRGRGTGNAGRGRGPGDRADAGRHRRDARCRSGRARVTPASRCARSSARGWMSVGRSSA